MRTNKSVQIMTAPDMFQPDLNQTFNVATGERISYGHANRLTTAKGIYYSTIIFNPITGHRLIVCQNNLNGSDKAYFKSLTDPTGRTIILTGKELARDNYYIESTCNDLEPDELQENEPIVNLNDIYESQLSLF